MKKMSTETIKKTTSLLNKLSGKKLTTKEIHSLCRQDKVRQKIQYYATELGFCQQLKPGLYKFNSFIFQPIHTIQILNLINEYNLSKRSKVKFNEKVAKQEKEILPVQKCKTKTNKPKSKKEVLSITHENREYELVLDTSNKWKTTVQTLFDNATRLQTKQNLISNWEHKYWDIMHTHKTNLLELKENQVYHLKKCSKYEELLITYKERIKELENEREKVRDVFFNKVIQAIELKDIEL